MSKFDQRHESMERAVVGGETTEVRQLLGQGGIPLLWGAYDGGQSALHLAVRYCSVKTVLTMARVLLDAAGGSAGSADGRFSLLAAADDDGKTAIHRAVERRLGVKLLKQLVGLAVVGASDRRFELLAKVDKHGRTAVQRAADLGRTDTVATLLRAVRGESDRRRELLAGTAAIPQPERLGARRPFETLRSTERWDELGSLVRRVEGFVREASGSTGLQSAGWSSTSTTSEWSIGLIRTPTTAAFLPWAFASEPDDAPKSVSANLADDVDGVIRECRLTPLEETVMRLWARADLPRHGAACGVDVDLVIEEASMVVLARVLPDAESASPRVRTAHVPFLDNGILEGFMSLRYLEALRTDCVSYLQLEFVQVRRAVKFVRGIDMELLDGNAAFPPHLDLESLFYYDEESRQHFKRVFKRDKVKYATMLLRMTDAICRSVGCAHVVLGDASEIPRADVVDGAAYPDGKLSAYKTCFRYICLFHTGQSLYRNQGYLPDPTERLETACGRALVDEVDSRPGAWTFVDDVQTRSEDALRQLRRSNLRYFAAMLLDMQNWLAGRSAKQAALDSGFDASSNPPYMPPGFEIRSPVVLIRHVRTHEGLPKIFPEGQLASTYEEIWRRAARTLPRIPLANTWDAFYRRKALYAQLFEDEWQCVVQWLDILLRKVDLLSGKRKAGSDGVVDALRTQLAALPESSQRFGALK